MFACLDMVKSVLILQELLEYFSLCLYFISGVLMFLCFGLTMLFCLHIVWFVVSFLLFVSVLDTLYLYVFVCLVLVSICLWVVFIVLVKLVYVLIAY